MISERHLSVPLFPTSILTIPGEDTKGPRFYSDPHVEIACSGSGQRTLRVGLRELDVGTSKGMIEIYQEGYEITETRWQGLQGECVAIRFPRSSTERLLREDGQRLKISTAHGVFNGQIARLGYELADECRQGMPNGPLFSEGISIALLGLLIRSHPSEKNDSFWSACLSCAQKRTISEFIDSELANHLTVEHMATWLEMSSYQFSRRFKSSFGTSPHQYILHRRLNAAICELRKDRNRPIAEIALEVGFSNQAHLTSAFRRYLGTTPARSRGT